MQDGRIQRFTSMGFCTSCFSEQCKQSWYTIVRIFKQVNKTHRLKTNGCHKLSCFNGYSEQQKLSLCYFHLEWSNLLSWYKAKLHFLSNYKTRDCFSTQCIPGRDMVEVWQEYHGWHKYTPVGREPKCLWEQLVPTLSKQNVCLMKDTNVTRCSGSENRCNLYPPERKLANQPSLNLERGAQDKIWPHQKILSPCFPIGWCDIASL